MEAEPVLDEDAVPPLLTADPDRCVACGRCAAICPHRIPVAGPAGTPAAERLSAAFCIRCGHCVAVCPGAALAHRDLGPARGHDVGPAPSASEVLAWFRRRRSVRVYQDRTVGRETLGELLEAARWAPTGHNARDLGCVAVVSRGRREQLREAVVRFYRRLFALVGNRWGRAALPIVLGRASTQELREALPGVLRAQERLRRGEDPLFHDAPAALLFHAPEGETAEVDCALAASQVTLLAPSLGLGTCYIGYASAVLKRFRRLARRFGVPSGHRVYVVLAVGYPAARWVNVPPRPAVALRLV